MTAGMLAFTLVVASLQTGVLAESECLASTGDPSLPPAGSSVRRSVLQRRKSVQTFSGRHASGTSAIPCWIHQTWKTSNVSQLNFMQSNSLESFKTLNPSCQHTLWSDADMAEFMMSEYPEFKKQWPKLKPIERADLFRYAVVHKHGGFYADLDVECLIPIKDWGIGDSIELVLGYETGWHLSEKERKWVGFARSEQFEQWLFAAVPGHPLLRSTLDLFMKKYMWLIDDTIELTGPGLFSDAAHTYLFSLTNSSLDGDHDVVKKPRPKKAERLPLSFPPGWKNDANVFIFSADKVAAPGFSTTGVNSGMIIRHGFEGTWKEDSK